ncbi:uncharacterized protein [Physcomitrium patens]|uniref:uncharacterized protein isoform X2 n=1 Tax=Physcomitrium patens TaxID=3218 RepID=UPI000D170DF7|nr:E3 ubiquitin-protein ligase Topors-like isoform X2 [Physcomitrium patens]|eukprot:XP_024358893.1 E3 ubiquitin-protein ligase Topors-like isoform X2 [Physcomitrella patens]
MPSMPTSSSPASRSRKDTGLDLGYSVSRGKENNLVCMNAEVEESGPVFRDESIISRIRNGDQGASTSSQEVMCPICLANIEESTEAVLQWCMHRFCTHCIEEWSRVRRVCPLCKAEYRGWYYSVQSNNEFLERILPPVPESNTQLSQGDVPARQAFSRFHLWRDPRLIRQESGRRRRPLHLGRQGVAPDGAASRSGSFPTQRSFGLPRQHQSAEAMRHFEEQAAAKVLRWRRSIYDKNLKARPFEVGKRLMSTKDAKERAERRLEPWIRRELQAVVPNSDHDFLVRLILGIWFASNSEASHTSQKQGRLGGQYATSSRHAADSIEVEAFEANAIKELKRFLDDKAELFWHELRSFAESPFTMQAYDTVVVYTRHDDGRRANYRPDRRL